MINQNLTGVILSILFILKQFSTDAASSTGVSVTVTWDNNGASTNFVMSQTVAVKGNYFAFALSVDQSMGNDDVAVCMLKSDGNVSLAHYYNTGRSTPTLFPDPLVGYSNIETSYLNNVVKCSFTRIKTLSNVEKYYDLTKQYYILFAYGAISADGSISIHKERASSPVTYDFQSTTTPTITGGSTLQTTTQIATTTTAAISNQTFTISWKNSANSIDFAMSNVIASAASRKKRQISNIGSYFAFGLSKDTSMGDDDVAVCILYPNGTFDVLHYYNLGKSPILMSSADPRIGFTNIKTSYANSVLTCSFTRAKTLTGVSNYFDLNSQYYLLTASGVLSSSGSIARHTSRASSPNQFNVLVDGEYSAGAEEDNPAKSKAHGCLMVFAWLFCASTGILFARYYKYIFPKKKLMGVQFWFFVHRPLMISVPIISLIAFLVILSDLKWKWVDSTEQPHFAHSIIGIITISFSFIQVFLAFFRCDKDHPQRFIFNHFHRTIGITTFVLAIVTIFLGVCIEEMNLGRSGWGIMIGWTIWVFVLPLIIEIFQVIFTNKEKGDSYKIKDKVNGQNKFEDKEDADKNVTQNTNKNSNRMLETTKSVLLVFHLVVAFAFTIALIILIGAAKKDSS